MINFGAVPASAVLPIPFASYGKTNGESITLTGLAVTDIEVYKGTSMTQRSSDAGYVLIDTDGIDIDGLTGIHGFSIDLGDNTDAGFYAVGSFYTVVVSAVTVDSQTVNFIAATFRIVAAEAVTGKPKVDVDANAGSAITAAAGIQEVKVASIANNAIAAAAIASDAITAAKIADGAIDAATFAAGAINATAIAADAITDAKVASDVTIASVTGAVGSVTGAVGSVTGLTAATVHSDLDDIQARLPAALTAGGKIKASLDEILAVAQSATDLKDFADDGYDPSTNKVQGVVLTDTLTTYTGNTPQTGDVFPLASTEIADIKAKTDNLPSDPADQSLIIAATNTILAKLSPLDTKIGAVNDAGASATVFITDLTESTNDYWKDAYIRLTSGALINQVKKISGYNGTTKAITVSGGFTAAPANGVTFEIVND